MVVRIGRAGDVVMTTQAILQSLPNFTRTLLTSTNSKRTLQNLDSGLINKLACNARKDADECLNHTLHYQKLEQHLKAVSFST